MRKSAYAICEQQRRSSACAGRFESYLVSTAKTGFLMTWLNYLNIQLYIAGYGLHHVKTELIYITGRLITCKIHFFTITLFCLYRAVYHYVHLQ